MAESGKINAVDLANIANLDAVDAANIAKVNGLVFSSAPAFTGLLDTYTGAAAGYSTRRLATSATNLMRIREDAGDTETDIGYDSNNQLDTAAIATHCGTANGYVVTWYDQSGNANNATQGTEASQPQIYDGSSVITENGKPALTQGSSFSATFSTSISQPVSIYTTHVDLSINFFHQGITNNLQLRGYQGKYQIFGNNGVQLFLSSPTRNELLNQQVLLYNLYNGADSEIAVNGNAPYTGAIDTNGTSGFVINTNGIKRQEFLVFEADNTNRTGIESNVNSNYLIYQPTDTPTSGLLATYSGAAAAYSVRQLANTAVMSMRVRRDSDDEEQNFGFDSNGDLDTAGIAAFCGSANGYVTRWWDQSTNGNHADQATDTSQPQIYDGSAVLTENGKPAMKLDDTDKFSLTSDDISSFFIVSTPSNINTNSINSAVGLSSALRGISVAGDSGTRQARAFTNSGSLNMTGIGVSANQSLVDYVTTGTSGKLRYNASNEVTGSAQDITVNLIGTIQNNNNYSLNGNLQEVLMWDTNQDGNRTGITTNVNTYFSIY